MFLVARKSGAERRRNLEDQPKNLRQVVEAKGGNVVGKFCWVGSGWDPYWLESAIPQAKALGADIILGETTDRYVRNEYYHSKERPSLQATDEQLQRIKRLAKGMLLMAHLHPDASPSEVRGYHWQRGQTQKLNKGGRPRKSKPGDVKHRRWEHLVDVRRARRAGEKLRDIAKRSELPNQQFMIG